jgi:acetamidase/formamidase
MTLKSKERTEALGSAEPALHTLRATPKTCHWGYFDAALAPALRVKSGDMIRAEAVTHHAGDAPELLMDEGITAIFDGIPEKDRNPGVHIITGPIFVEDAKVGDVIEVRYLQMIPRLKYGSNLAANWGYLYKEFGETERVTVYQLDGNSQQASAL